MCSRGSANNNRRQVMAIRVSDVARREASFMAAGRAAGSDEEVPLERRGAVTVRWSTVRRRLGLLPSRPGPGRGLLHDWHGP
jgi:hypothetical protein